MSLIRQKGAVHIALSIRGCDEGMYTQHYILLSRLSKGDSHVVYSLKATDNSMPLRLSCRT